MPSTQPTENTGHRRVDLRALAPDAYRAMAERVGPYAPAAWLEAQGRSQLLAPESVGLLRALTAHPMSDTDVVAAVSAAGAGALDGDTLRRLNDSQSAWLKRDHKALYWRSARQLADSVGEVVAHVQ